MNARVPFTAVVGAGQVGATTAQRILEKGLADVVLFDVVEGMPQGKALDLMQAAAIEGHDRRIFGTNDYRDIEGAQVVVITAGSPRKPGMSREDLLSVNAKIVREICLEIAKRAPSAIVMVVTNPLDIMTYLAIKATGFAPARVFGMAGLLDSARMRFFIAQELGLVPREVQAMVLGGHGDLMVPVLSHSKAGSDPIQKHLSKEKIAQIQQRTREGGAEMLRLLKTGSAFYAPASAVTEMVKAVLRDERKILPVCAWLQGEYGLKGFCFGVPAELSKEGIRRVVEISLRPEESQALQKSAQRVQQDVEELRRLGFL